jgi:hypothetical protein
MIPEDEHALVTTTAAAAAAATAGSVPRIHTYPRIYAPLSPAPVVACPIPIFLVSHCYLAFAIGRLAAAAAPSGADAGAAVTKPGSNAAPSGPRAVLILCSAAVVYCWIERCISAVWSSLFCLSLWAASTKSLVQVCVWSSWASIGDDSEVEVGCGNHWVCGKTKRGVSGCLA